MVVRPSMVVRPCERLCFIFAPEQSGAILDGLKSPILDCDAIVHDKGSPILADFGHFG